jgi:2-amino-4-hydroxy-6-hydroxymethyldihydropteridine diphosphokinase
MARVFVGIGSNISPAINIPAAITELVKHFPDLRCSRVFESEAVGFDGENFYNLVAEFSSSLSVTELSGLLRQIELQLGRSASAQKFSARTVDIDLLLIDDLVMDEPVQLPRAEILENAFVLWPLSELAPELKHPIAGFSYRQLWQSYDRQQRLWPISMLTAK